MAETLQVRNLARDPQNHAARRLRPGNRKGWMLGNGVRMRKKGVRATDVSTADLSEHLESLLDGVREGYLEVTDSTGKVLSVDDLAVLGGGKVPASNEGASFVEPVAEPVAEQPAVPTVETVLPEELPAEPEVVEAEPAKPAAKSKKKGTFGGKDKD